MEKNQKALTTIDNSGGSADQERDLINEQSVFDDLTEIEIQEVADIFDSVDLHVKTAKLKFIEHLQERRNCLWVSTIKFKKAPRGAYGPTVVQQDIKSFKSLDDASVQNVYARGRTFLIHFGNTLSTTSEEDEQQNVNELVEYLEVHDMYNEELAIESTSTFYVSKDAMRYLFNDE
eukprot:TRINITY_DN1300_c0_g1_i1.p1 TRINITY_DN1300_c0_g1~~TRINITY_DN1300_c0_g1_i1.p1  ORF type:complete len:176 (+),score=0.45 TRINITY_DN1300_c0_g1_i1:37-564(+)